MDNNQIKIHFVRAKEYMEWRKNLQNFEEIMPLLENLDRRVHPLPHNKPLSDILDMFTSDDYPFQHLPLKNGYLFNYRLFHPASGKSLNFKDTLHEQGVNDNDIIVVELNITNPNVSFRLIPVGFVDDLIQIFNMNNPNQITVSRGDKNSPLAETLKAEKDENPLYAILLYTEEDINIAKYVRKHYGELNNLSGKTRVFVFEAGPEVKEAYQYWSNLLSNRDEYIGWNALGLTKTKPYDKARIFELCDIFEISKNKVPCILFFNNLNLNDKKFIVLKFTKDEELKDFFRDVFTICDKAVKAMPEKRIDVLASQFRNNKVKKFIYKIITPENTKNVLKKAVGILENTL